MTNKPWFKPLGLLYRPVSWQGAVCTFVAVAFCIQVFVAIDRHSHSVSDTLFGFFPYVVSAFLLWNWLADKTCGR